MSVSAPREANHHYITSWVKSKAQWVDAQLAALKVSGYQHHDKRQTKPTALALPALDEVWQITYQETEKPSLTVRSIGSGIIVTGAIDDIESCQSALRRWLIRRAEPALSEWMASVAAQTVLSYSGLSIRNQRTRWGSCSAKGRISLNCNLLFLSKEQVRYVMIHELCHTLELNHSNRFWGHVKRLEPNADQLHHSLRLAWQQVPAWVHKAPH